jgi:hypothetical protein
VKRILFLGLLAGVLTASSGCGLFQSLFCYRPCGATTYGDACSCGGGCEDGSCGSCRPARVAARRAVVADCDDDCDGGCGGSCGRVSRVAGCRSCDPCSDPCGSGCIGRPWHRGPLSCLFALFTPNTWCGCGCGQRYWGDFYSDPPACQDPCDGYGNYAGGSGGGCRSCGGGHGRRVRGNAGGDFEDGMTVEGDLVPQADRVVTPTNRSSGTPTKAVRPAKQPEPQQ